MGKEKEGECDRHLHCTQIHLEVIGSFSRLISSIGYSLS